MVLEQQSPHTIDRERLETQIEKSFLAGVWKSRNDFPACATHGNPTNLDDHLVVQVIEISIATSRNDDFAIPATLIEIVRRRLEGGPVDTLCERRHMGICSL